MVKLELEKIYKDYCNSNLETLKGEDKYIDMMVMFVEFRLNVSGGTESSCMVSMVCVGALLDEIHLYDNMMDDWGGQYRGDFRWENFERLKLVVDSSNLEAEFKNRILEGYKLNNGMEDEG